MNRLPDNPTSEIQDLLAAYALDALEQDERDFIARNLHRRPEWRKELREYQSVATALAHLPDEQDVPLRVRARVLAEVDAIESDIPLANNRRVGWNALLPPLPSADPAPEARSRWAVLPRAALITSMPATVVAIVFAMYTVIIHSQIDNQQSELAAYQQKQGESAEVLTSGYKSRQVIDLVVTREAPLARGSLFIDKLENAAMLVARDLPSIPDDESYVVWALTPNTSQGYAQIGVLEPDETGTAQILIAPPESFERYLTILVTREATEDTLQPSGPSIMSAGI